MISVYKNPGETPLDVIKRLQNENPELLKEKMAYAGRLDPMAEGLLLILVGEECKKRKEYERLEKTYEFEVLFGIATDTYDILGKITKTSDFNIPTLEQRLVALTQTFTGTFQQEYPPYSSARVNGKPLFYWAREGKIDGIKIPSKQIRIYSFDLLNIETFTGAAIEQEILLKLSRVQGDFRQPEIIESWQEHFKKQKDKSLTGAKFIISCSSGTYVRSIANELGRKLMIPTLALSIKRTKIGPYQVDK